MTLKLVLALCSIAVMIATGKAEEWDDPPAGLAGTWQESNKLTRALGFASPAGEGGLLSTVQIEFFASKQGAIFALGEKKVRGAEEIISKFQEGKHEIVAVGQISFRNSKPEKQLLFVSYFQGKTYLWTGDLSKSVTVTKVNSIRGIDERHDHLILDYGGFFTERSKDKSGSPSFSTRAYQRK